MTHQGLVPEYECFEICRDAWTSYIQNSLRNLIVTGKGQPNGKEKPRTENEKNLLTDRNVKKHMKNQDYTANLTVDNSIQDTFKAINSVTKWWTDDLTGSSQKLNDEFTVQFGDIHRTAQKIIEFIPDKKVVWLVTESKLNFIKDKKNGKIQKSVLNYPGRAIKHKSILHISDWFRRLNVSKPAVKAGIII